PRRRAGARARGGGALRVEGRGDAVSELVRVSEEVAEALRRRQAVVALETTIVAHGFPPGEGLEVGRECERQVREAGAIPATGAVIDGTVRVGLGEGELDLLADAGPNARKVGPRDLAACAVSGELGATTVGGTLAACRSAGIGFMATGGIGGVHRGWAEVVGGSADLAERARVEALVGGSGAEALLGVPGPGES